MAKRKSLELQMREALRETKAETEERFERTSKIVSAESVQELRTVSAKRSGKYAKGWRWRTVDGHRVVYNTSKPTLTHLLNDGHAIANQYGRQGGRVNGDHHIDDVAEKYSRKLVILNLKDD